MARDEPGPDTSSPDTSSPHTPSPHTPSDEDPDRLDVDWDEMLTQLARQPHEEGWVTLDEASEAAGVSRSTLRSWYRNGQIPSRMVAGVHGPQRLVPLEAVVDRALRSARARRQLEHARSVEAEVAELRRRVEALERHLGLR
ncbi:MAG: helix-turn-helix domain-containing protein [Acidimicrobiaceae bacterium]|nr:helix-turn-helix domain-containing protein [Acidimicrobiaceae bacterium]